MKQWWFASFFAIAVFASSPSSSAHAQTFVQSNVEGTHAVGMVNNSAAIVTQKKDGTCLAPKFVPNSTGGLTRDVLFLGATFADNTVVAIDTPTSFCGVTISPLVLRGFQATVTAGQKNDLVVCFAAGRYMVNGSWGNDVVIGSGPTTGFDAGAGEDLILGDSTTFAFGGDGDDIFCPSANTKFNLVNGGRGTDALCGLGAFSESDIEVHGCSCPF